jgi:tRNA(Ile)-lysidine synthase
MWRSNVLRLRNCSSAAIVRNRVKTRWYSSENSLAVTEKEFEWALKKVLQWKFTSESKTPLGECC